MRTSSAYSDNIRLKRCILLASPSSFAPLSHGTPYENRGRRSLSEFNKLKRYEGERKTEGFYVLIRFSRGKPSTAELSPFGAF